MSKSGSHDIGDVLASEGYQIIGLEKTGRMELVWVAHLCGHERVSDWTRGPDLPMSPSFRVALKALRMLSFGCLYCGHRFPKEMMEIAKKTRFRGFEWI